MERQTRVKLLHKSETAFFFAEKTTSAMKKAVLLAFLLPLCFALSAQIYVDGIRLDLSNSSAYMEVVALRKEKDGRYHFVADYGQTQDADLTKGDFLTDEKNNRYEFRSMVDGLNFLYENGWEVHEIYVYNDLRRYLLKRK
jgi:hypothetical protein